MPASCAGVDVRPRGGAVRARDAGRPPAATSLATSLAASLAASLPGCAVRRAARDAPVAAAPHEIRHAAHRGGGGVRRDRGRASMHGHTGRPARTSTRRASPMRIALLRKHYCARILHTDTHTSFEEHTHGDSIEVGSEA